MGQVVEHVGAGEAGEVGDDSGGDDQAGQPVGLFGLRQGQGLGWFGLGLTIFLGSAFAHRLSLRSNDVACPP